MSSTPFTPYGDRIYVEMPDFSMGENEHGIIIPERVKTNADLWTAKVTDVSPSVEGIKAGQTVTFMRPKQPITFTHEGKDFLILSLRNNEIVGIA